MAKIFSNAIFFPRKLKIMNISEKRSYKVETVFTLINYPYSNRRTNIKVISILTPFYKNVLEDYY